jgi:hypothetical protein
MALLIGGGTSGLWSVGASMQRKIRAVHKGLHHLASRPPMAPLLPERRGCSAAVAVFLLPSCHDSLAMVDVLFPKGIFHVSFRFPLLYCVYVSWIAPTVHTSVLCSKAFLLSCVLPHTRRFYLAPHVLFSFLPVLETIPLQQSVIFQPLFGDCVSDLAHG